MTEVVLTQTVPAPLEQVYAAWTSAQGWARWWWPHWADTTYVVDARPGGQWRAHSAQGGSGVHGTFVALDPPRALELTWVWEDDGVADPAEDRVLVELSPGEGGTTVTVRHTTGAGGAEDYRQGWEFVLGNLTRALTPTAATRAMTLAGQTVTVRQLVPVPPERAYDAWLDPELLARWWWPELPDTTFMVQAAVGGRFRVRSEAAGIGAHGMFLELVTGERIVMTWVWETGPAESPEDLVTVRFVSHAGGTEVVLDHAMAVPSEDTSRMEQGWAGVLAELNAIHGG